LLGTGTKIGQTKDEEAIWKESGEGDKDIKKIKERIKK
jgi:hypothetical protein